MTLRSPWLLAGGLLSPTAAAAHLGCLLGGPSWYRFFGAGERMARGVERGALYPTLATVAIAGLLGAWGAYALSGAGVLPRLPLLRVALVLITAVYLARGLVLFFPAALRRPDLSATFLIWSSLIVLAIGLIHAIGLWRAWPALNGVS